MALDPDYFFYSDGTITLTNGSDIATGNFTAWDPAVLPFDFVYPNDGTAGMSVIKEVLGMDEIRLAKPWSGPDLTDVPYFMVRWTRHTDPRIYAVRVSDYLTRLKAIPENLEEVAGQISEDAAAVAAALPTFQAAIDAVPLVDADREAAESAASTATAEANRAASYVPSGVAKSISGLIISNHATTPLTMITVSPGAARDKDNNVDIVLSAGLSKSLTAFAAGAGNGMLDTGAAANFTPYHIFVIRNPTTSAVDILASSSPTAPVMPAGFTQRRRIGIIQTNGSAQIFPGLWRADGSFEFAAPFAVASGLALATVQLITVLNNAGIKRKARFSVLLDRTVGTGFWFVARDPDVGVPTAATPGVVYKPAEARFYAGMLDVWTDTAGRIYVASSNASASDTVTIVIHGWTDLRDEFV